MSGNGIQSSTVGAAHAAQNQPILNGVSGPAVDFTKIPEAVQALYQGLSNIGCLPLALLTVCKATKDFVHPTLLAFQKACHDTQATLNPKIKTPKDHTAYPSVDDIITGFQAHQNPNPAENELAPLSEDKLYLKALNMLFDPVGQTHEGTLQNLEQAPQAWRTALTEFLSHPVHGLAKNSSQLWKLPVTLLDQLQILYPAPAAPTQDQTNPAAQEGNETENKNKIGQILEFSKTKKAAIAAASQFSLNTSTEEITNFLNGLPQQLKQDLELGLILIEKKLSVLTPFLEQANFTLDKPTNLKTYQAIVTAAVTSNRHALQLAQLDKLNLDNPEQLKTYQAIVTAAVTSNRHALQLAQLDKLNLDTPEKLKTYQAIVTAAVTKDGLALEYAKLNKLNLDTPEHLKTYQNIVTAAVTKDGYALQHAQLDKLNLDTPEKLKTYQNIVTAAITKNGLALEYAKLDKLNLDTPEHLKTYQNIVTAAVTKDGLALEYAKLDKLNLDTPEHLKTYQNIVTAAVTQNGYALQHAKLDKLNLDTPEHLKTYQNIVTAAVTKDGLALEYAQLDKLNLDTPEHLKTYQTIVTAAVKKDSSVLKHYPLEKLNLDTPEHLKTYQNILTAADYYNLKFTMLNNLDLSKSDHFTIYHTIVTNAFTNTSYGFWSDDLQHAQLDKLNLDNPEQLKTYQTIVTAAVKKNGRALQHANFKSLNLKNSNHLATFKHILLDAIKHHGLSEVVYIMQKFEKNFELKRATLLSWMAQEKINLAWQRCKAHITPTFAKCFTGQPPQQPPSPPTP